MNTNFSQARPRHPNCRGVSVIELMIGIAIGLVIIAGALVAFGTSVRGSTDTIRAARLNQDVGAVMAVMTGEIQRAGYEVCDTLNYVCRESDPTWGIPVEIPLISIEGENRGFLAGEDLSVPQADCILLAYNDGDTGPGDLNSTIDEDEQKGFRLSGGAIQMSETGTTGCGDGEGNWVDLTDPGMMTINTLSFTSEGSKCRNVNKPGYWVVTDTDTGTFPCALTAGTLAEVEFCDTNCATPVSRADLIEPGDKLAEEKIVNITIEAELVQDDTVVKELNTSVRVVNNLIVMEPEP